MKVRKINGLAMARQMMQAVSHLIQSQKQSCPNLPKQHEWPRLAIILLGDHPASLSYIRRKRNSAKRIGIKSRLFQIPETDQIGTVLEQTIHKLNKDPKYHGILLQLPLPDLLNPRQDYFLNLLSPNKDVDCLTEENKAELQMKGQSAELLPCTAHAVLEMLKDKQIELKGKTILIIGKGKLVGDPLFTILSAKYQSKSQITIVDNTTPLEQIQSLAITADIIITATGKPDLITDQHMKQNCIVIDVGVCRDASESGKCKVRGDISEDAKMRKCEFYSPVPKGVGPLTVSSLMLNTYKLWKRQIEGNGRSM